MRHLWYIIVLVVTLVTLTQNVEALVESIPMPSTLLDCFGYKTEVVNVTEIPAQNINAFCIDAFLRLTYKSRFHYNVTEDAMKWVHSLLRSIASKHERHKRQAISPVRRFRNEVRMLTPAQWNQFTGNVNRLKNDLSIQPNRYDALALLHQGIAEASAHGGSNFLGWHTIYLLVVEEALRVPIPYWDSTLDYNMNDPVESIVWTSFFFGNGNGQVVTGPFAFWQTPAGPLRRNINSGNSLMMTVGINFVLSRIRHSQIVEPQQDSRFSLEAHHNGVHNWVDGLMAGLSTSAMDPIFFLHHSFIEQIWHRFKEQQDRIGINRQYFPSGGPLHLPFRRMDGFPGYRNIDGYNDYFRFLVVYAPSPFCPQRCSNPTWNFPVLQCNGQGLCQSGSAMNIPSERRTVVATRMGSAVGAPGIQSFGGSAVAAGDIGPPGRRFGSSPFSDPRTRNRGKRSVPLNSDMSVAKLDEIFMPYQNTLYLDGVANTTEWAFLLVKVTSELSHSEFKPAPLMQNNNKNTSFDNVNNKPATYDKCLTSGTVLNKVFVQSHGINYEGKFKNYVIVNDDVSSGVTIVGFKNPAHGDVKAYVSSFDLCGRVCQPKCLVMGSNPPEYRLCSGTLRLSSKLPMVYYSSYGQAENAANALGNRLQNNHSSLPIFMEFVCKNLQTWPWNHLLGKN